MRVRVTCALLLAATIGFAAEEPSRFARVYEQTRRSVVIVEALDPSGQTIAQGSGFVASGGKIVTNLHVLAGATTARVTLHDGETITTDFILASDELADLAVLALPTQQRPLPLAKGQPNVSDEVISIGNPLGLTSTLTNGLVSGVREIGEIWYVQTTTPISPGNSGGPLINMGGEVVGVTTFQLREAQNLNFAVAVHHVRSVLKTEQRSPFPREEAREEKPVAPVAPSRDFKTEQAEVIELSEKYGSLKTHAEKVRFLRAWASEQERSVMAQAAAFMLLGGEYETHDSNELALSFFEAALSNVNDVGSAMKPLYYRLCRSYLLNERYHEAVDACIAAVDEAKNHEVDGGELKNSWSHLGEANEKTGRLDASILAYKQALAIDPMHQLSLEGLARVYQRNGDSESFRQMCAKVKKENPGLWRKVFRYGC